MSRSSRGSIVAPCGFLAAGAAVIIDTTGNKAGSWPTDAPGDEMAILPATVTLILPRKSVCKRRVCDVGLISNRQGTVR